MMIQILLFISYCSAFHYSGDFDSFELEFNDSIEEFFAFLEDDEALDLLLNDDKIWEDLKDNISHNFDKTTRWVANHGEQLSNVLGKVNSVAGTVDKIASTVGTVATVASVIPGVNAVAAPIAATAKTIQASAKVVKTVSSVAQKTVDTATDFSKGYQKGGMKQGLKQGGTTFAKNARDWAVDKAVGIVADGVMGAGQKLITGQKVDLSAKGIRNGLLKKTKEGFNVKANVKKTFDDAKSAFNFKKSYSENLKKISGGAKTLGMKDIKSGLKKMKGKNPSQLAKGAISAIKQGSQKITKELSKEAVRDKVMKEVRKVVLKQKMGEAKGKIKGALKSGYSKVENKVISAIRGAPKNIQNAKEKVAKVSKKVSSAASKLKSKAKSETKKFFSKTSNKVKPFTKKLKSTLSKLKSSVGSKPKSISKPKVKTPQKGGKKK